MDYWPVLVNGRHRGDIWLAWDMSDRKKLERQRVEAQRQLAEQNEGEAEGLTPEGVRFLDIIERNADRLHRLVGDLLMLDRLEAGALPLDLAPVSIPDLAAEAVRSAAPAAVKQGIAIEVSTGDGPLVAADHRRLMQVLDNLIANAVKFSNRNRRVHRQDRGVLAPSWLKGQRRPQAERRHHPVQHGRQRAGEHSRPDGSTIVVGGSGRLWVRGQSCKLTGCTAAINGESFPPDASGPRARGKGCHAFPATASTARPAEPALPETRGETPPGRGRVRHPARRPDRHRPRVRPVQLAPAETGLHLR